MPVYVYECAACQKQFEVQQRMSDAPLKDCECGEKGQLKRLISAGSGIIFKGSGFYQTDYKGNSNGGDKKAGSSEPKSDSKPEAKTEPNAEGCGAANCCMNNN